MTHVELYCMPQYNLSLGDCQAQHLCKERRVNSHDIQALTRFQIVLSSDIKTNARSSSVWTMSYKRASSTGRARCCIWGIASVGAKSHEAQCLHAQTGGTTIRMHRILMTTIPSQRCWMAKMTAFLALTSPQRLQL